MAEYQFSPYSLALLVSTLASMGVAIISWRKRPARGSVTLALLALATAVWSLAGIFEFAATNLGEKITWSKIAYLGIATGPVLFLLFALEYGQYTRWLTRRKVSLLIVVPLITVLLAATNDWHHWHWSTITLDVETNVATYAHDTFWFGVFIAHSYGCMTVGIILLLRTIARFSTFYTSQVGALLIASVAPFAGNILYVSGLSDSVDYTPVSFAVTSVLLAWGIFRLQLFNLVPVARNLLVENMADGMLVIDAQHRILDINPAALRLLIGDTFPSPIGQPAVEVLPRWLELAAVSGEEDFHQTERTLEREGQQRIVDLRVTPLHDRHKRLTGWLVILRDITRRKQAERALQQRTLELEARNAELDAFAHTVAHDLKNPLANMIGYGELILMDLSADLSPSSATMLQELLDMGYHMGHIVDALLKLATVRQQEVTCQPLDMAAVVAQVMRRLQTNILEYQAMVIMPMGWPPALGYAPWVEEVWANYLSNALKYGGRPPRIELGAETPPQHDWVRFWVRDNGPGLSENERARLFVPFTRLCGSNVAGHGLGLSIVQRIVHKLGGQVGVESQPGQGSLFYFTLPAASVDSVREPSPADN